MSTPDPARLVQLLTDAGFRHAANGRGYQRFTWPDDRRESFYVWTDITAPEHGEMMAGATAELREAADVGRKAQRVLDGLEAEATT